MSIYKRKSGRYAVLIDLESSATGLRRRKSVGTFRTRKDAEAAERKALDARDRGIDLSPKTVTVIQLLDRFIADRRARGRALPRLCATTSLLISRLLRILAASRSRSSRRTHVTSWLATIKERGSVERNPSRLSR